MKKIISGLLFMMILTSSCKKETTISIPDQTGNIPGDSTHIPFNEAGYGFLCQPVLSILNANY
jgi:hypothetical protein